MSAAWLGAKLSAYPPRKPKDFAKLEPLLAQDEPRRQTWQEQLAVARKWAAVNG
jgi:hypothetical protein